MFDSKKLPFALGCVYDEEEYKTATPETVYRVMFKSGDDIKQDHLVLQLFRVFDNLWK